LKKRGNFEIEVYTINRKWGFLVELKEKFIKKFKEEFDEFWETGKISSVSKLNQFILSDLQKFRNDLPPSPFYGNINSEIVFVNYNSGIPLRTIESKEDLVSKGIKSFDDYFNAFLNFGNTITKADSFDSYKQLAYLIPFDGVLRDFGFEKYSNYLDTYKSVANLQRFFANICQFELIRYGSQQFNSSLLKKFSEDIKSQMLNDLLEEIFMAKRKIVFFNGQFFYTLLSEKRENVNYLSEIKIVDKLARKDGGLAEPGHYSVCEINYQGKFVKGIINHTFPAAGFTSNLMEQYSREILNKERDWIDLLN
jgi:hypothetical protein